MNGETKSNKGLQQVINAAGFSIFRCITDLGYVGYSKPASSGKDTLEIDAFAVPHSIVDVNGLAAKLPLPFADLPPHIVTSTPNTTHLRIDALHAILRHKKVDKDTIDFFFGGSSLGILARAKIPNKKNYVAMMVPDTKILMIHHERTFDQDYSDLGYQFERIMTGRGLDDARDKSIFDHVQLMNLAGSNVILSAQVDGVDSNQVPVEVMLHKKAGSGGSRVMFQMISSGSMSLVVGRYRNGMLERVRMDGLDDKINNVVVGPTSATLFEGNIARAMKKLKSRCRNGYFDGGKVCRISFDNDSNLLLTPMSKQTQVDMHTNKKRKAM